MSNDRREQRGRSRWGRALRALAPAALLVGVAACDPESAITLPDPDLITIDIVEDPDNLDALRNGVLFEFARAYSGPAANNQTPGIIGIGGLLADELWYASTFPTMRQIDQRSVQRTNGDLENIYQFLHRARNLAAEAGKRYAASDRANSADHALVQNLNAYTYVFFGENFCSGVPVSSAPLGQPLEFGGGLTTVEMFEEAVARFDDAIVMAQTAGSSEQLDAARIGKARALQALDRHDEAAAAVADVSTSFQTDVTYSQNASSPNNGVWYNINTERRSSAATRDGENGLSFFQRGSSPQTDPRIPVDSAGFGLGGTGVPLYVQGKYPQRGSDIPLASGIEARLIEAETLLDGGASAAYLPVLNALRATVPGLGDLADPGNPDDRVRQLFEERAYWLWLTGHRLGDLRRMVRQYGFGPGEVFPTGPTIFGSQRGSDVNFPIPEVELNNPEFTERDCFDRGA